MNYLNSLEVKRYRNVCIFFNTAWVIVLNTQLFKSKTLDLLSFAYLKQFLPILYCQHFWNLKYNVKVWHTSGKWFGSCLQIFLNTCMFCLRKLIGSISLVNCLPSLFHNAVLLYGPGITFDLTVYSNNILSWTVATTSIIWYEWVFPRTCSFWEKLAEYERLWAWIHCREFNIREHRKRRK